MQISKLTMFAVPAMILAMNAQAATQSSAEPTVHFRATVQNLTGGNVLSPYISLVHKHNTQLFEPGQVATAGIAQIAETGATSILEEELAANPIVLAVTKAEGGPFLSSEKWSIEFEVPAKFVNYGARFTVLAMIGKSNDSFVAFRNIELKRVVSGSAATIIATNYDAGSEENSGNVEDFGPGGHPVEFAEGHISFDRGLNLKGNAPESLAWGHNAAQLTLEIIK